jgi:hypothetical protein
MSSLRIQDHVIKSRSSEAIRRQNVNTLSFKVEAKKSMDYFNKLTQRVHLRGDFPDNYVPGVEAELTAIPCSKNPLLCQHFSSFATIPRQVGFNIITQD